MEVIEVDDPSDPRIADFVGLRDHELRLRRESAGGDLAGIFVAEGDVVVERALRAGYEIRSALVDATRTKPLPQAVPRGTTVFAAGPNVIRHITGMGVHRGMMAAMARRAPSTPAEVLAGATRIVVLERVVNPTNLGVIARSAAGLGADAIRLDPTSVDPLYRRASRFSMGEVFALPHARLPPFPEGLDLVTGHGFSLLALSPGATESIDDVRLDPSEKVALVLGSEGPGLESATLARIRRQVHIPLHRNVDSLNVAAAAAIACYVLGRGRS